MGQFVVVWSFPRFYPSPAKSTAPERDFARASPLLTPKITHGRVVMLNKDPPPGFSPAKLRCCGHWRSSGRRPCTRNSRCEPRSSIGNYLYTGILMYIYIYICICIYLYACVCVLWILYIYIYTYVCVCGLSIGVYIYIYLFIFKKKCVCVCVCVPSFHEGAPEAPFQGMSQPHSIGGDHKLSLPGLVNIPKAIEMVDLSIEIVDLPIQNGDFP